MIIFDCTEILVVRSKRFKERVPTASSRDKTKPLRVAAVHCEEGGRRDALDDDVGGVLLALGPCGQLGVLTAIREPRRDARHLCREEVSRLPGSSLRAGTSRRAPGGRLTSCCSTATRAAGMSSSFWKARKARCGCRCAGVDQLKVHAAAAASQCHGQSRACALSRCVARVREEPSGAVLLCYS